MLEWFGVDQAVALIIFTTAGLGMTCNWFVVSFISKVPALQNAFGKLTTSQALAEAIHLSIFTFLTAPMIFLKVEAMENASRLFGQALLICYDVCVYTHFLISMNRMVAVMLPLLYDRVFSMRNTRNMIIGVWALAITSSIYLYGMHDCEFHYVEDCWYYIFKTTPVCAVIAWYTDFLKSVTIVVMIVCMDLFTLIKVHTLNTAIRRTTAATTRCRKADEINFLEQTCLQGAFFVWELLAYFVLYNYFESRYVKFFFTTFAWILVHSADGFITLIFNRDFHQIWKKKTGYLINNTLLQSPSYIFFSGLRKGNNEGNTTTATKNKKNSRRDLAYSRTNDSNRY